RTLPLHLWKMPLHKSQQEASRLVLAAQLVGNQNGARKDPQEKDLVRIPFPCSFLFHFLPSSHPSASTVHLGAY
uniref:Uncharacterized protein n=1 Tax=Aquila chrysaetos chrysaetos TaxID=223781 RepID=A0A663E854_AQUCH